jgi:hypothetical protein
MLSCSPDFCLGVCEGPAAQAKGWILGNRVEPGQPMSRTLWAVALPQIARLSTVSAVMSGAFSSASSRRRRFASLASWHSLRPDARITACACLAPFRRRCNAPHLLSSTRNRPDCRPACAAIAPIPRFAIARALLRLCWSCPWTRLCARIDRVLNPSSKELMVQVTSLELPGERGAELREKQVPVRTLPVSRLIRHYFRLAV